MFPVGESVACAKGGETVGRRRGRSHYDAEEPIFWAAWRDATRYAAMLRDYHNNRRYYSVAGFAAGVERASTAAGRNGFQPIGRLSLMHF